MALDVSQLEEDLLNVFQSMNSDDKILSQGIANAVKDFVRGGSITTTDAGGVPAGTFTGSGSSEGVTLNPALCDPLIYKACLAMNGLESEEEIEDGESEEAEPKDDAFLARELSLAINKMVTAPNTVNTDVSGTVVSGSSSSPLSGSAIGSLSCVPLPLENKFKEIFEAMGDTSEENFIEEKDEYMAEQMADAINIYVLSAVVNTSGSGSLSGSVGVGSIS